MVTLVVVPARDSLQTYMPLNLWVELLIAGQAFLILKPDLKSTSSMSRDLPGGGITGSSTQMVLTPPGTLPVTQGCRMP